MPHRRYYVEFSRAQKRAYIRPLKREGLPWFGMDVLGNKGVLLTKAAVLMVPPTERLRGGATKAEPQAPG